MAAEMSIYTEVKELYDEKASLMFDNCYKALTLASRTLDDETTADFLKGYFENLIQILLDQYPGRTGSYEQGLIEKSLACSLDIILQMMDPPRDPFLYLDVLIKIFSINYPFYSGGKVQWQNFAGNPQARISLIQKFFKSSGFSKIREVLVNSGKNSKWMGADRLQVLLRAIACVDPSFKHEDSREIRTEVMNQLLNLPDDVVKKEPVDVISSLINAIRPKSDADSFVKDFQTFWLEHTAKMMNCSSILLKLFAWEQMHDITREAARTRPTPSKYIVSNAGTDEVNGVYIKVPVEKNDNGSNKPPKYRKESATPKGKVFTIIRCNMRSQAKWWFLSIVDEVSPGGTNDIDYYQHKSTIDQHAEPPELNWEVMPKAILGKAPAPTLTRMERTKDPDCFNEIVLQWISQQNLIEKVFGQGIHREIVSRSKSLVLLLVEENRLTDDNVMVIYRVGIVHQEDDVVEEVFNLLANCSRYMNDASYAALMGHVQETISSGGVENIQRVTLFLKKIHNEGLSQMKASQAKSHLAKTAWALHKHPQFASLENPVNSGPVSDVLIACLRDDSEMAVSCLNECCKILQDHCNLSDKSHEKLLDRSISTIQFFLSNHFVLSIEDVLADHGFHATLMAELKRFVSVHGLESSEENPHSPSNMSLALVGDTTLSRLASRLHTIRCAFGVSSVGMKLEEVRQIWDMVRAPGGREQVFLFLRNAASAQPRLNAVFDASECLEIFENIICSSVVDWSSCGLEAYRCFESYFCNLPYGALESTRRSGRNALWTIVLDMPVEEVAEEAIQLLLKSHVEHVSDDVGDDPTDSASGPYAELLGKVFKRLHEVQSSMESADDIPKNVHDVVSRCTILLTALLGKSKPLNDVSHGVRGSLFRIKVKVRYQEVISSSPAVYNNFHYPTRSAQKHKTRSAEKCIDLDVHPMHSLRVLKDKIMSNADVSESLKSQNSSKIVDVWFGSKKLDGDMLPISHFGITNLSELSALLGGDDKSTCEDVDLYFKDNQLQESSSGEESSEGSDAIIGECIKSDNFYCLLSLVELLDRHGEASSKLSMGIWSILMATPTQPDLLLDVEMQFHHAKDGMEGYKDWERLFEPASLPNRSSVAYSAYVMQIIDGILQPAPELRQDSNISLATKDRFVKTGGFSNTLVQFVSCNGSTPIGKMFLSVTLHVLYHCVFDSRQEPAGENSLDLEAIQLRLDADAESSPSASALLIAEIQESSAEVLEKLLSVAHNAAVSSESEIVKDALSMITTLLESPTVAAQLTSSPQAQGLLTAVLRSSSKTVRHTATDFAVQVGRSQPVVVSWLLTEIKAVVPTDKYCYSIFKTMGSLVSSVDDSRTNSELQIDLSQIANCLSSKLLEFQKMSSGDRSRHNQFELECSEAGESSMLLGTLELLKSIIDVKSGYAAFLGTALGESVVSTFMDDFLCPPPEEGRVPICDTKALRAAAFGVLTSFVQMSPQSCNEVVDHISALSASATAMQLKHEWGLHIAQDLKAPSIKYSGLRNHGCTCYLNSLLQQLFMNESFRQVIMSVPIKDIYRSTLWHLDDAELVGKQFEFEWMNGTWHLGEIIKFDEETKLHTIQYNAIEIPGQEKLVSDESVVNVRQGSLRKETGRVRAVGIPEEDKLNEREANAVLVLEQLQRAFCFMEKSEKRHFDPKLLIDACKTLNLEFNVYHQNDASELLDKLLDRLETAMKGKPTGGIDKYTELNEKAFGGKMLYQKIPKECERYETDKRDCGHWQESRDEVFFKCEATVRGCEKITDALGNIVEGELMDGDNKIMCDVCNTKKDTVRRTCFGTLPNCLIVHLKRFDLDYETFETVKLNTKMEFETKLSMYPYTKEGIEAEELRSEETGNEDDEPISKKRSSSKSSDVDEPEEVDMLDYEYELQGVLVHCGVAQGGHYYSYIKDSGKEEEKWFLFDDDEVTPFNPANIPEQCFGGKFTTIGHNGAASADDLDRHSNALMLFYKKVKPRSGHGDEGKEKSQGCVVDPCMVDGYRAFSREVGHSNARHILTKYIIDTGLHDFVRKLLTTVASMSPADHSLVSKSVRFGCHFFLDVVLHCRERRNTKLWVSVLSNMFAEHPETALSFFHDFIFAHQYYFLKEFLLNCADSLARSGFVQLLSGAVGAIVPSDSEALHDFEEASDSTLLQLALEHRSEGWRTVGPPVLALLLHCLRSMLKMAPLYLLTCDELFCAFRDLAKYPAICSYMLRQELIPLLLYFVSSNGATKIPLVAKFFHKIERQSAAGQQRNIGAESRLHHPILFECIAAIMGVPQEPQAALLEDTCLTEKARVALTQIFEEHAKGNHWNSRDLMAYLDFVEESVGEKNPKASIEARGIMERYGSDHLLSQEGFLRFSTDRALYNPKAVWKDLRAFRYRNDLSRGQTSDLEQSTELSLHEATVDAKHLPLSNETLSALLSDPEIFAEGMSASEQATVAIIRRLPEKQSLYALKKACELLFVMMKNYNWLNKEAAIAALITALVQLEDGSSDARVEVALTGKHGYLSLVLNLFQHQKSFYSHQEGSLLRRYQDLLRGLLAVPRVQRVVSERAAGDKQYSWLQGQVQELRRLGRLDRAELEDRLRRTVVRVAGAGEGAVDGEYRFSRLFGEHLTALFQRETVFRGQTVTFQMYRCRLENKTHQWFISLVPAGKEPGTNADEDFYCKPSSFKPQQPPSSPALCHPSEEVTPPEGQWQPMRNSSLAPAPVVSLEELGEGEGEEKGDLMVVDEEEFA